MTWDGRAEIGEMQARDYPRIAGSLRNQESRMEQILPTA